MPPNILSNSTACSLVVEKEAADEAAIGVAKAAAQNASVHLAIPATGVPKQ